MNYFQANAEIIEKLFSPLEIKTKEILKDGDTKEAILKLLDDYFILTLALLKDTQEKMS